MSESNSLLAGAELKQLSDPELISGFRDLVIQELELVLDQLEHILELDRRKLFLDYPSLKMLLVEEYGMEGWLAERKIRSTRLLGRFPGLRRLLALGKMNISLMELAMGCARREKLMDPELWELLEGIAGMSCKAARREIACRYPHSGELPWDQVRPLTEELSELRCVLENEVLETLEEIRGILAHSHPGASFGELLKIISGEYCERHHPEAKARRVEERKAAQRETEVVCSPTSTRVPDPCERRTPGEPLRNEMTLIQGYQCSFTDPITGRRCTSKHALEPDHIRAWADGGKTVLKNLRWLCPCHHKRISFLRFGPIERARR